MMIRFLSGPALLAMAGSAAAQQAGENMVQAGWVHFAPFSHSQPLSTTLRPSPLYGVLGVPEQFSSPGTSARVESFDTAAFTLTHFFTGHFAAKLDLGIPARVHLDAQGTVQLPGTIPPPYTASPINLGSPQNTPLASAIQWDPAVLLLYYFGKPAWRFHPYAGAGTTYNWFTSVSLNSSFQDQVNSQLGHVLLAANGRLGNTHMAADVGRNWSPLFTLGLGYDFDRHWGTTASLSYVLQSAKPHIHVYAGDGTDLASSSTRIGVDPLVAGLFANYRF